MNENEIKFGALVVNKNTGQKADVMSSVGIIGGGGKVPARKAVKVLLQPQDCGHNFGSAWKIWEISDIEPATRYIPGEPNENNTAD